MLALAELKTADAAWMHALAAARPGADFEDNLIPHVRENAMNRRLIHPLVKRIGMGVAAVLALGIHGRAGA